MTVILALLLITTTASVSLERLSTALLSAPAWEARFSQTYVPAGLETGSTDSGTLTIAPPLRLLFEYTGEASRVFAVDGTTARLVDRGAATCDAVALDRGAWARLPLATLFDPAATRATFVVSSVDGALRLVPREPTPDLAEVVITPSANDLPERVVVTDRAGNRNEFRLTQWRRIGDPGEGMFRPHLPGAAPCLPDER